MLAERQRVELRPDPEQWIRTCLRRLPFHEAQLNVEVALASRALEIRPTTPPIAFWPGRRGCTNSRSSRLTPACGGSPR